MEISRSFDMYADRYTFDFHFCTPAKGFAQVDTGQDASYFGTWANPTSLQIVSYCEGDVTRQKAETPEEFAAALRQLKEWNDEHGHGFLGIDPLCHPEIEEAFRSLGLDSLLH